MVISFDFPSYASVQVTVPLQTLLLNPPKLPATQFVIEICNKNVGVQGSRRWLKGLDIVICKRPLEMSDGFSVRNLCNANFMGVAMLTGFLSYGDQGSSATIRNGSISDGSLHPMHGTYARNFSGS